MYASLFVCEHGISIFFRKKYQLIECESIKPEYITVYGG